MNDDFEVPELNPRIRQLKVGTRTLRKIKVYPFSAGQQLEVVELIGVLVNAIGEAQTEGDLEDLQVLELFSSTIKDKLGIVIGFVTDPEAKVTIEDFDNDQLADFVDIIFEVNFGGSIKKFQTVWSKARTLFPSPNSSQKLSGKQPTA